MPEKVVWLDTDQVRRPAPNVLPVVDDADHVVPARKEGLEVGGLEPRVEALVPGEDPGGEEPALGVEQVCNLVSVQPGTESADVEFEQGGNLCQELAGVGAEPRVVPGSKQHNTINVIFNSLTYF